MEARTNRRVKVPQGSVSVEVFHDRVNELLALGYRPVDFAAWIGYYQRGKPDGDRFLRDVGLKPYQPRGGCPMELKRWVSEEKAAKICRALHLDPWEVGI